MLVSLGGRHREEENRNDIQMTLEPSYKRIDGVA